MQIIDRTDRTAGLTHTRGGGIEGRPRCIFSRCDPAARRHAASIRAVMLHQTGFQTVSVARLDHVAANYAVMPDGRVLRLHPFEHALNSLGTEHQAIDIEIVGQYPSLGAIRSQPPGASGPAPPFAQIKAARDLVTWLNRTQRINEIYCHAQFEAKNCCGPQLWYNVGKWAIDNLRMINIKGRLDVLLWWSHPWLEIDDTATTTAVQLIAADMADHEEAYDEKEPVWLRAPWLRWECWLAKPSRARRVKRLNRGVVGVFETEADAAAEAQADRPWQKPWGWECWIRSPSRAMRLKMADGGIIGVYETRQDAVAECHNEEDFWRKANPY